MPAFHGSLEGICPVSVIFSALSELLHIQLSCAM